MHTALISGWASLMLTYELLIVDWSDPVYHPIWRQGMYVLPSATRLGVTSSLFSSTLGTTSSMSSIPSTIDDLASNQPSVYHIRIHRSRTPTTVWTTHPRILLALVLLGP